MPVRKHARRRTAKPNHVRPDTAPSPAEAVILLHGLLRSSRSMGRMARALRQEGYQVVNVDYRSRSSDLLQSGERVLDAARASCRDAHVRRVNFVTHSLGGILLRAYLARQRVAELGRVVMLGPPNRGSELVDRLGRSQLFRLINGPAAQELGTGRASLPNRLGPVNFPLGVIAGSRSVNWINSLLIPGPDDGKVSIERTRVSGMADHLVIPATHPFLMMNAEVIRQTLHFLRRGRFDR